MILICERCYAPIDVEREEHVTYAHIDRALRDGTVLWVHSAVHTAPCGQDAPGRSPGERPDAGEWDASRRGFSPAAAAWIADRSPRDRHSPDANSPDRNSIDRNSTARPAQHTPRRPAGRRRRRK
jgi:hypothetical protein